MKRVLITGASGPLGIMLIRYCLEQGTEVIAVVRENSGKRNDIPRHPLVQVVECSLERITRVTQMVRQPVDVCFHLAWSHTGDFGRNDPFLQAENIQFTLETAKAANQLGCKVFIGAGSQAEYGIVDKKISEDTPANPNTLYGIAKLAAGRLVMEYCRQNEMRCNWVRIFAVYGPYENDYIFTSYMIRSLLEGKEPELTPCGQVWDYLYCKDAVRALYLVAEKAQSSSCYCLGSGHPQRMSDYVFAIRDAVNPELAVGIGKKPYSVGQIMYLEADIGRLQKDTGFVPQYSFREGIKETVAWYRRKAWKG